jgi:hypothetical protein
VSLGESAECLFAQRGFIFLVVGSCREVKRRERQSVWRYGRPLLGASPQRVDLSNHAIASTAMGSFPPRMFLA